jgi:hypothetical protein
MSLKRQFIESFVQGLGRTSAAIIMVGALTGVYYLATEHFTTKVHNNSSEETEQPETESPSFILLKEDGDDMQSKFQSLFEKMSK